ncbi:MAG: ABC transporter permease [Methanobacteriaceae archaeon]|nr:ABC transporter permease [Methanobacteriaceae archaeon]MDP2836963.1 ABC transporter permease [Methanobacteriaceae archaeon]MDP3034912.1 ABC transporter permease [Methanobacteriaceae archaeon]MDP3485578.1 ABC transporter permease [Methanobacteriaceae archaeon]MDP3624876.1 ABC transporter permease [Methanobacteriaceae archaeon]
MNEFLNGMLQAINLILTLNPELVEITTRTLFISLSATFIAALIAIPLGGLINFKKFKGKRSLINLIQTLYSLPTVLVGLFVFLLLSQQGVFGDLNLLFTPTGMIIGQTLLILPILIGFTITALKTVGKDLTDLSISLGASEFQTIYTIMREAKYAIMAAVILGFGRAISEVGVAIMIGGNIRGATRVITTTISLETSKGNLELSIALGIILLGIALIINLMLNQIQEN